MSSSQSGEAAVRRTVVEEMFLTHRRALEDYARRRVGDDRAGDVVNEVFSAVLASDQPVPPERERLLWLFGFARRKVMELQRRRTRDDRLLVRVSRHPSTQGAADHASSVVSNEWVSAFIGGLSPDDAELLRLVVWDDLSIVAAANVLNISPGAARSRIHRIRKRTDAQLRHRNDADTRRTPR